MSENPRAEVPLTRTDRMEGMTAIPDASNPAHQAKVRLAEPNDKPVCSDDRHAPVVMLSQFDCAECGGDDPYGQPWFCPICEYCCGC